MAASLAACGRGSDAAPIVRQLCAERRERRRSKLAQALAPYAPELALEVAASGSVSLLLHAGLLKRLGRHEEAASMLAGTAAGGTPNKPSEWHLFASNSQALSPDEQLGHMNAFLGAYSLPALSLANANLPPGPMNLRSALPLPKTHGPLVSILITTFRSGSRAESAIRSLLEQTYQDIEVIVVDDASDDETWSLIEAIAGTDSRVKCLRLPCNVGTYVAKTIGLGHATGEFVTCNDSDDWSHPLKIERQVRPLLRNSRLVCTTSEWVRMQDDGLYYARQVYPFLRLNPASPMFRKELVMLRAGTWDLVRTGADSEFLARLKLVFGPYAVKRVRQPLAFGSHRAGSLMTASDTGYSTNSISPARLDYWESWVKWHIEELAAGRRPRITPGIAGARRFPAPQALRIPPGNIAKCMELAPGFAS